MADTTTMIRALKGTLTDREGAIIAATLANHLQLALLHHRTTGIKGRTIPEIAANLNAAAMADVRQFAAKFFPDLEIDFERVCGILN